ncbi:MULTISPECIES: MotA/TolQ/ExbB proton channel family protein [unclassified Microbacterium]|uniref:motility protein A n=1 Tax=unclassified Microbacterium TaxID=2609290 RepID=UPI001DF10A68|nr:MULTISPECIES: MotA/TolQ/ExbB proton channel family protein [unclassified Microbacterium]CAH0213524.1 Chemotaxis protein PomA [Microbacterium sp. Bi121]HWK76589.1 MotA/TolQ/ExbB proton channel family protein [Microbacterium sp.]
MDPSLILGLVLAFGALLAMIGIEGASVTALLLPAPMILVFGGTIAVGIATGTIRDFLHAIKALPRAFRGDKHSASSMIDKIVGHAEKARSEGLLALEQSLVDEKDPFLRQSLQSIADGVDAEELRTLMEDEITSAAARNRTASKFYMTLGGFAPTVGIVGTVVSLTHVLENLDQPDELGHMIAAAFVATLWGLLSANFIWLPIGGRLQRLGELEVERMTLVMEGMLAVQAGSPPQFVGERLRALVAHRPTAKSNRRGAGQGAADPAPTS